MPTIFIENKEKLPERKAYDFYPTPIEFCRAALNVWDKTNFKFSSYSVLDAGCGNGVWGEAYRDEITYHNSLWGIDVREVDRHPAYDCWLQGDFLEYDFHPTDRFGFIMGNPPFSFAHEFVDRSFDLLNDGGYLGFLLKLTWLETQKRYNKYFSGRFKPKNVWVSVRRISFTGDRKTNADAYCFVLWQKGWTGKTELDWLYWEYEK